MKISILNLVLFLFFHLSSLQGQNIKLLESRNGFLSEFKFGMTSEEIESLHILHIPPKSEQHIALEYSNKEVTYVLYAHLDQKEKLRKSGVAYFMGKPYNALMLNFYRNKLFKIGISFSQDYPDTASYVLEKTNEYFNIPTILKDNVKYGTYIENGVKFGNLSSNTIEYEGRSKNNNTLITFTRKNVDDLIAANLPYNDENIENIKRPKIYALVVGINDYSKTDATMLKYCVKDSDTFSAFLKSNIGGSLPKEQIILLKDSNATKENIRKSADQLFSKAESNDIVIFFFSGHGGANCFLGYDQLIFHKELKNIIYNSKAKIKICIADACHSGSWDKKYSVSAKDMTNDEITALYYQSLASAGEGIILFMASQTDETSLDDQGLKQGLFTYFVIEGLKGSADTDFNHLITIQEIYDYTKAKVSKRAMDVYHHSQNPQLKGTFDNQTPIAIRN